MTQLVPKKAVSKSKQARLNSAFKRLWSMHWWMAASYLLLYVGGFWMIRMPEDSLLQENAYTLHKSFGALTMALLTWRIFLLQRVWWRKYTRRLPKFTEEWMRTFLLHSAIYLFMFVAPLSGFFLSNSYQSNNVPFFWVTTLPDLFPENEAVLGLARDMHFWVTYTLLGCVGLHVVDQKKYVRALWRRLSQYLDKVSSKQTQE
jgi:cytochrome b561